MEMTKVYIDIAPIQREFSRQQVAGQITLQAMALRCGWANKSGVPDNRRMSRALGILPESNGRYRKHVTEPTAKKMANALGLDPVDLGF